MKLPLSISVIIPTLNEEQTLSGTLGAIKGIEDVAEVIVSDGASSDRTTAIARQHNCQVIGSARGRGLQLDAGARAASGNVLWFVHADTRPPPDAAAQIRKALDDSTVLGGHFCVRFDGAQVPARAFGFIYRTAQLFGLCYGDSAYFVRRQAYEAAGGFRPLPLFEDLDLRRRLLPLGRFVCVPGIVITSGRRFAGRQCCDDAFALGIAPTALLDRRTTLRSCQFLCTNSHK